jgi:hypothetical protein
MNDNADTEVEFCLSFQELDLILIICSFCVYNFIIKETVSPFG